MTPATAVTSPAAVGVIHVVGILNMRMTAIQSFSAYLGWVCYLPSLRPPGSHRYPRQTRYASRREPRRYGAAWRQWRLRYFTAAEPDLMFLVSALKDWRKQAIVWVLDQTDRNDDQLALEAYRHPQSQIGGEACNSLTRRPHPVAIDWALPVLSLLHWPDHQRR